MVGKVITALYCIPVGVPRNNEAKLITNITQMFDRILFSRHVSLVCIKMLVEIP